MKCHITLLMVILTVLITASCSGGKDDASLRTTIDEATLVVTEATPSVTEDANIADGNLTGDGTWEAKSSLPTARSGAAAAVVGGKMYVIGGYNGPVVFDVNECYDPSADTWTTRAPMPDARSGAFAAVVDGKIYVIGGVDETAHTLLRNEMYDPLTDTWTTLAPMPTHRAAPLAAAVDGKIYVIGGIEADILAVIDSNSLVEGVCATNEEYDPSMDTWTKKRSMPTPRWRPAGCAVDDSIYVIGGWGLDGITNINERYDPTTDSWSTMAPMPTQRTATIATIFKNKIYVIGGHSLRDHSKTLNEENILFLDINEEYDIGTDTWVSRQPIPTGRGGTTASVIDGKIYLVGGALIYPPYEKLTYSDMNEEYTPPF